MLFREAQALIGRPVIRAARTALATMREAVKEIVQRLPIPSRPTGMCEAQRAEYLAACDGKITWRQYFAKWGADRLTL
jgi:hypothetical protein